MLKKLTECQLKESNIKPSFYETEIRGVKRNEGILLFQTYFLLISQKDNLIQTLWKLLNFRSERALASARQITFLERLFVLRLLSQRWLRLVQG